MTRCPVEHTIRADFKELPMRAILMLVLALALLAAMLVAQNRPAKTLDIYVMDVEGGDSQLYVAPSRESVLIDTGNAGAAAVRDADRIMAAGRDACLRPACWQHRGRTICRQPHHVRQVSCAVFG